MMLFNNGVELFCAISTVDQSKHDLLFVNEELHSYFLLTQADPFFDVETTNRITFDILVNGLLNLGFKKGKLKIF